MNYQQYLFQKLAEEASEIAKEALKCALFGTDSTDPREKNGSTNLQKLKLELLDMTAVLTLLQEEVDDSGLPDFDEDFHVESKRTRLKYYYDVIKQKESK